MTTFGDVQFFDDGLRLSAPPFSKLTPAQALDMAEVMTRAAFHQMLAEEMDAFDHGEQD